MIDAAFDARGEQSELAREQEGFLGRWQFDGVVGLGGGAVDLPQLELSTPLAEATADEAFLVGEQSEGDVLVAVLEKLHLVLLCVPQPQIAVSAGVLLVHVSPADRNGGLLGADAS